MNGEQPGSRQGTNTERKGKEGRRDDAHDRGEVSVCV